MKAAAHAEVGPHAVGRGTDAEHFARLEREGLASLQGLPVALQGKRRTVNDTGQLILRLERGACEGDLQRRGRSRIADQGIADGQGGAAGGPADRYTQAARVRPATIDDESAQARLEDSQGHANARMAIPFRVKASRSARTNATAAGLSPCTQMVWTPRSRSSHSTCATASFGLSMNAPGCERGTREPSGR